MGNQQSVHLERNYNVRHRTLDPNNPSNRSRVVSRNERDSKLNNSFATPPINQSYSRNLKHQDVEESEPDENQEDDDYEPDPPYSGNNQKRYQSIDASNLQHSKARYREATPKRSQNDRILQNLGKKNEALRKQLKTISDELSKQLKKKKFVPKKKKGEGEDEDEQPVVNNKQLAGLKRQLENGYKQIDMYKKTIQNLRGKEEGDLAQNKLSRLSNDISTMDGQIEKYIKKIEGVKRIKNKQDVQIDKDINDDLREGVATYKRESALLKDKLKQYNNRDRQRQANYKKQQAYLCDLERKARQLNGDYFPELGSALKKESHHRTAASEKQRVNPKQFNQIKEEAMKMRAKHQEYYRKIDQLLQAKNRVIEDQNDGKEQIIYKERIIEALKKKLDELKKLLKPSKNKLFGYGSSRSNYDGSDANSQYQTPSQIERQIQEELNQDQFDIKHLIANIPKPIRKRPQELSNGYSSGGSSDGQRNPGNKKGGGMVVTSEKAQPKKWGGAGVSIRTEQRGKNFKGQLHFEDRAQFDEDVQPLIVGVNVWVNKNNSIVGIQAIYLNKEQLRYGIKSCDAADGMIRRFDLQNPDYLKNLTMTVNSDGFVESISLYSKQGKVGKFGNKREVDEHINFGIASNERPFMFMGASTLFEGEPRLNLFGMEICNE